MADLRKSDHAAQAFGRAIDHANAADRLGITSAHQAEAEALIAIAWGLIAIARKLPGPAR